MRVSCNRENLLAAFQMVSGVVPARSPKPILVNVKLVAETERTYLLATDLDVGIRYRVSGVGVQQEGEAVLPTTRVNAILRESSDAEISIEADEGGTRIWGSRSRFQLPAESPGEFPQVPDFEEQAYHEVDPALLRTMIRRTIFAADVESMRYALNGVLLETEGNQLSLVGTDGRRLAVMRGSATGVGGHSTMQIKPVVPTKAMNLVERNLQAEEDQIAIAVHENKVLVRTSRAVISSRLVEGRFPQYQEVFPKRYETRLTLNVKDFLQSVRQAAIITSDENRGVDMTLSDGKLLLVAQAAEIGQSEVELPISFDGKELKITFDPRYLIEMLRVLSEESAVTLDLVDSENAAVFRTEDGYSYVVMPLTRER